MPPAVLQNLLSMRVRRSRVTRLCSVLWVFLLFLAWAAPSPHMAAALQAGEPVIRQLEVSLWPEYDDPRLLVIYRGELASVPTQPVRLPIPADAEVHAVAYVAEDGMLVNLDWRSEFEGERRILILSPPTTGFQVEYYWDVLGRGPEKSFTVSVDAGPQSVEALRFQVQEPVGARDLQGDPPLQGPAVGFQGLNYYVRDAGSLIPGAMAQQTVRYVKADDRLSAAVVQPAPTQDMTTGGASAMAPPADRRWLYGVAVAFLTVGVTLAAFGIWRTRRGVVRASAAAPSRRRPRSRGRKRAELARFCHACGHSFEPDDRFCARCGAERRRMTAEN